MVNKKVISRIFNLLILLFFATPFIYILIEQLKGNLENSHLLNKIQNDVEFNLIFITSFMMPFIGLYMIQIKKDIIKDRRVEKNLIKLFILAVSFLLLGNMTFVIGTAILIILITFKNGISIKDIKKSSIKLDNFIAPVFFMIIAILVRYLITFTI